MVVYGSRVRVDCSVFCAFDDVRVSLIFFCASFVFCFLDRSVPGVTKHPKMFRSTVTQVCFSPLSPCKNGHPETTRNPCATRLRFQISVSSIDRCPPFRAKRQSKGGYIFNTRKVVTLSPRPRVLPNQRSCSKSSWPRRLLRYD